MAYETEIGAEAKAQAAAGRTISKRHQALGLYEPMMRTQFFPRCVQCGAPSAYIRESHPLAARFPDLVREAGHGRSVGLDCIVCGAAFPPAGPMQEVPAVITGMSPSAIIARACFALGKAFARLRRRFLQ